jgi:GTP 3',8-cyclase
MPAALIGDSNDFIPRKEQLTRDELVRLARIFVELGVRKIRITGGEPLLRRDLLHIISDINKLEHVEDIALTTNGYLLERFAEPLKRSGLHRINISLDALDDNVFGIMNGVGIGAGQVLDGIRAANNAGHLPIKINMVVKKGVNDRCALNIAEHFKGTGNIVRFIEFMDVGNKNNWKNEDVVPSRQILELIHAQYPLAPIGRQNGDVAERYRYVDGTGEIGFISSITRAFCGDCNRARLSSSGEFFTCLFSGESLNLRSPLREGASDSELRDMITKRWSNRRDRYSEERVSKNGVAMKSRTKVEMYKIGG